MPPTAPTRRFRLLPREGLTLDPLLALIRALIINPSILLPLLLLLKGTSAGQSLTLNHEIWVKRLRYLLYLGVFERVNAYLSRGAINNWTEDDGWDWEREVVVVTGGSSGIGRAVVEGVSRRLLEGKGGEEGKEGKGKGGRVVVLDVLPMEGAVPPNVHYIPCDLTSTTSLSLAASQLRAHPHLGHPTVLINNAGVCRGKTILDSTENDLKLVFGVNTLSHWFTVKEFLPNMIKTGHGHVVTVASVGAYVQAPRMVDYNASKAAAVSFHEGLAAELRFTYKAPKVRTTLVTQGYVQTPLFEGYRNDSKFLLPALHVDTLAEEIVAQVFSGKGGHIVLPRAYNLITSVRGWFSWMQIRLLAETGTVMDRFGGRQVIDPNVEGPRVPVPVPVVVSEGNVDGGK
ncbi:hypothetical protein DFH27DRAFT_624949 [Peziza echinospora]|nr:hypothetical protein DFH27DRAFT_624949 [Peziza echinospora]